ncbi:MAG: hypothetical protein KF740_02330 [Ramlibacter sp.]|nr:hypothetical protein [Ramlibacter sp.]
MTMNPVSRLLREMMGPDAPELPIDGLGLIDTAAASSFLSFLESGNSAARLNANPSVQAAFVRDSDASSLREDITPVIVDDPKWSFFKLVDMLAKQKVRAPTAIAESARIHPTASIAGEGVVVEDGVVIEPGVVVLSDVTIRSGAVIRAGAVVGVEGFEHKRTSRGLLSVQHDGVLEIGRNAEVGPNNAVAKGFSYRPTLIGNDTKLDALVHYAHGVQSGERCFIAANAMIAGHVALGDDVWVGPSVSISNRLSIGHKAFLTIGSVVVRDVAPGEKVTGYFAMPHMQFLRSLGRGRR